MLTDEDIWKNDGIMSINAEAALPFDILTKLSGAVIAAYEAKLREQNGPIALPFAILDEEMKDLHRFHECVSDGEGYDVPKERMKHLAEIGLVRRVTANIYEHTTFGLSVINGDFNHPAPMPEGMKLLGRVDSHGNVQWFDKNPHAFPPCTEFYAQLAAARSVE